MCSFMARSLWREMLDVMHEGDPYGHLAAGGEAIEPEELSRLIGLEMSQVVSGLKELERRKVFSRTDDHIIFCRRMVRDEARRALHAEAGKMGGNPKLKDKVPVKPKVKPRVKPTEGNQPNQNSTPSVAVAVATALQLPERPENVYAFMGAITPIWREIYGGNIPPGTAKRLKPAVGELGEEEVARRFRIYCEATEADFVSIPKFVATIGRWDESKSAKNGSRLLGVGHDPTPEELASIGIKL